MRKKREKSRAVNFCKIHGELNEINSLKEKDKSCLAGFRLRCRECTLDRKKVAQINRADKLDDYTFGKCYLHGQLNRETTYQEIEEGRKKFRCRKCRDDQYTKLGKVENKICHIHGEIPGNEIGSRGRCKICIREYAAKRDKEHRNFLERQSYYRNIEKEQVRGVTKTKNITIEEYKVMVINQGNKCAICNKPETMRVKGSNEVARLAIDHDHRLGFVRQLLCNKCNKGLGHFEDNVSLLQSAIDYLRKHSDGIAIEQGIQMP